MSFGLLVADYTFQIVLLGTVILGMLAGALGSFAVLRQQSLLGDCIAHAALPGICLTFLVTLSKSSFALLMGALIAGIIGALFLMVIRFYSRLKEDAALGIVLSVFFGVGLVLLTYIQQLPYAHQSGLHVYLFGSASTLLKEDVMLIVSVASVVMITVVLFWKEFKLVSFDSGFLASLGYPVQRLEFLLTTLLVFAIVIGLQTVGVVLMSALVIAPAVAARQWTKTLGSMVIVSACFGGISSVMGVYMSSVVPKLPTGPVIVLVISGWVVVSLLFAPSRGLIWAQWRHLRQRRTMKEDKILLNFLSFSETQDDPSFAHDISVWESLGESVELFLLLALESKGLIYSPKEGVWGLTDEGVKRAEFLLNDRGIR